MIDVYAPEGAFPQENAAELLRQLAECFLHWTDASDIPIARNNTGAYLHVLPRSLGGHGLSNAELDEV